MAEDSQFEYLYGINPINSILKVNAGKRRVYELIFNSKNFGGPRIRELSILAEKKGIESRHLEAEDFRKISGNINTQGVIARVSGYNYSNLDQCLGRTNTGRLVILDSVTDVGNFASIIRNCSAFGFEGIIISKNRSVALNKQVSRISAGALEEVKVFRVPNIVNAIKELKEKNFWIYGSTLEENAEVQYLNEVKFIFPMALILGSEGKGMGRLISENCDTLVSIKMSGGIQSLNVSVASGILMYSIQEQYMIWSMD